MGELTFGLQLTYGLLTSEVSAAFRSHRDPSCYAAMHPRTKGNPRARSDNYRGQRRWFGRWPLWQVRATASGMGTGRREPVYYRPLLNCVLRNGSYGGIIVT